MTPETARLNEKIEADRQRREDAAFGYRKPTFQRKPLTAEHSWWEEY